MNCLMRIGLIFPIVFTLVACDSSSSKSKSLRPKEKIAGSEVEVCKNIFLSERIDNYNRKNNLNRVVGYGKQKVCAFEVNISGKVKRLEKEAFDRIEILPQFQLRRIFLGDENNTLIISALLLESTNKDIKNIIDSVGFDMEDSQEAPIIVEFETMPRFLRLGEGALFTVKEFHKYNGPLGREVEFKIRSEPGDKQEFEEKLSKISNDPSVLELIWDVPNPFTFNQSIGHHNILPHWRTLAKYDLLSSMVHLAKNGLQRLNLLRAMYLATEWNLDPLLTNKKIPELYKKAEADWKEHKISFPSYDGILLLVELEFLLKINPNHQLNNVYRVYLEIERLFEDKGVAVDVIVQFQFQNKWSTDQFKIMKLMAAELFAETIKNPWNYAEVIFNQHKDSPSQCLNVSDIMSNHYKRKLIEAATPESAYSEVLAYFAKGLNEKNKAIYFSFFDELKSTFSSDAQLIQTITDELILKKKLSDENLMLFKEHIHWLVKDLGFSLKQSYENILEISEKRDFSEATFELHKNIFNWLNSTGLTKNNALSKASEYSSLKFFNQKYLEGFKMHFKWLNGSHAVYAVKALEFTEKLFFEMSPSDDALVLYRRVADWFMKSMKWQIEASLDKASEWVFSSQVSEDQIYLFIEVADWMQSLGSLKSDFIILESEELVIEHKTSKEGVDLYRKIVEWYGETIAIDVVEGLSYAKKLIVTNNFTEEQFSLLSEVTTWLMYTVEIEARPAAEKSTTYLLKNQLTYEIYLSLKNAFQKYKLDHKNAEALALAEAEIFQ